MLSFSQAIQLKLCDKIFIKDSEDSFLKFLVSVLAITS